MFLRYATFKAQRIIIKLSLHMHNRPVSQYLERKFFYELNDSLSSIAADRSSESVTIRACLQVSNSYNNNLDGRL